MEMIIMNQEIPASAFPDDVLPDGMSLRIEYKINYLS